LHGDGSRRRQGSHPRQRRQTQFHRPLSQRYARRLRSCRASVTARRFLVVWISSSLRVSRYSSMSTSKASIRRRADSVSTNQQPPRRAVPSQPAPPRWRTRCRRPRTSWSRKEGDRGGNQQCETTLDSPRSDVARRGGRRARGADCRLPCARRAVRASLISPRPASSLKPPSCAPEPELQRSPGRSLFVQRS